MKKGKGVNLLSYADDTIIFIKCDEEALEGFNNLLHHYEHVFGQHINMAKSSLILSSKCDSNQVLNLIRKFDFKITNFLSFTWEFLYLLVIRKLFILIR